MAALQSMFSRVPSLQQTTCTGLKARKPELDKRRHEIGDIPRRLCLAAPTGVVIAPGRGKRHTQGQQER